MDNKNYHITNFNTTVNPTIVTYYDINGSVKTLTTEEYFKDKPIDYEKMYKLVDFNEKEKESLKKWDDKLVNLYPTCDKIAYWGGYSIHNLNPSYNPDQHLKDKGYKQLGYHALTGCCIIFLETKK